MKRHFEATVLAVIAMLAAQACRRQSGTSDARHAAKPEGAQLDTAKVNLQSYDLDVIFDGLVAYVPIGVDASQNADRVWALLVDANYPSKSNFSDYQGLSDEFPPCAYNEVDQFGGADKLKDLTTWYPAHETRLRIRNADVVAVAPFKFDNTNAAGLEVGEPIAGMEVVIRTSSTSSGGTLKLANFDDLGSDAKVHKARNDPNHPSYDKLASRILQQPWDPKSSPELAARVLLDHKNLLNATMTANVLGCKKDLHEFGYTAEISSSACNNPTDANPSVQLAEDVVLSEKRLQQPFEIIINGGILKVAPSTPGEKVTVEILNLPLHHLSAPDDSYTKAADERACNGHTSGHYTSYRWFYRLSAAQLGPSAECAPLHVRPCEPTSPFDWAGGRKCPQRLMNE